MVREQQMNDPDSGMRSARTTLRVLETVADLQPVGVSAVARATGVPKSSAQRCLRTLHESGWLTSTDADRTRWVLTGKALTIGLRASADVGLRESARGAMQRLRDETAETIHLSSYGGEPDRAGRVPQQNTLIIVDRLDSTQPVRTWVRLGTEVPLHASCSGRAVLARLPDVEVDVLLSDTLERYTDSTLYERDAVLADLRTVRARGYATVEGGWRPGVGAVAAALLGKAQSDKGGRPVGALAISMPIQRYDAERAATLGPLVAEAAADISTALPDM